MNTRKLNADQVRTIRVWWRARQEARKLPVPRVMAQRMGVSHGTLYSIGKGFRYKEVR